MIDTFLVLTAMTLGLPSCSTTYCSCSDGGPQHVLEASDAVFIGIVLSVHDTAVSGAFVGASADTLWQAQTLNIKVIRGWKDPGEGQVQVLDVAAHSSCASYLPPNRAVLVYAKRYRGILVLLGCGATRNKRLDYAREDLAALGPPTFARPQ